MENHGTRCVFGERRPGTEVAGTDASDSTMLAICYEVMFADDQPAPALTSVRNEHRASRKHVTGVIRSVAQRQRDPTRSPRAGTRHIRSVFGSCNVPRSHNFNGCTFRFHESFGFYEQVYLTSIDADDLRELAPREESFCRRCVKKSANVIASRVPPQNAPGLIA